jgi:hypothetical protein
MVLSLSGWFLPERLASYDRHRDALGVVAGAVCALAFIDARIDTGANVIGP